MNIYKYRMNIMMAAVKETTVSGILDTNKPKSLRYKPARKKQTGVRWHYSASYGSP